jgi:hypothetical protein
MTEIKIKTLTVIYKMLRRNDPDLATGVWGNRDCMGSVRSRSYSNAIGIGGKSPEAKRNGIAGKVAWIGIKPRVVGQAARAPVVAFEHFLPLGNLDLRSNYPNLAALMYDDARYTRAPFMHWPGSDQALDAEVENLLQLAENAPPSKWGVCRVAA